MMPILTQYVSSVRAEIGEITQPMLDAADNLDHMASTQTLGTATGAVRRAAVLLIKAGQHEIAARLLGWVDARDSNPISNDLAAEMEHLLPEMCAALGEGEADVAATTGAEMSVDEAIMLARDTLRRAATAATAAS
jgi:hypothetical protein